MLQHGSMKDFVLSGVRLTHPRDEALANDFLSNGRRNSNKYIKVVRSTGLWTSLHTYKKVSTLWIGYGYEIRGLGGI